VVLPDIDKTNDTNSMAEWSALQNYLPSLAELSSFLLSPAWKVETSLSTTPQTYPFRSNRGCCTIEYLKKIGAALNAAC